MNRGKHPLYIRHYVMMRKCYDDTYTDYPNAGGIGLTVYRRWHNIDNFFQDIEDMFGLPPVPYAQLARKNPLKGWTPSNIVGWTDHQFVATHRPYNNTMTYKGKTQALSDWAREYDINFATLWSRVKRGYTPEQALTKKPNKGNKFKPSTK